MVFEAMHQNLRQALRQHNPSPHPHPNPYPHPHPHPNPSPHPNRIYEQATHLDAGGKVSVESFRKVLNGPTPTQPFVR